MQLCCRIRLELSEQIIPAKGSQEPLPNGGAADKAAFCEIIMEAELLTLCEQGLRCVWHVCPPPCTQSGCQRPPTPLHYLPLQAETKAGGFFVIAPTFLPGALGLKGRDWISFLLSKHFNPIFHDMHHSPQAGTKQVSAMSLLQGTFLPTPLWTFDAESTPNCCGMLESKLSLANFKD